MAAADLTAARLRELLHYNPDTGVFTWRFGRPKAAAGAVAGCTKPDGYIVIGVDGFLYRAHRLAWLYMMGAWPSNYVDHINGTPSDNKWANLRDVRQETNLQNQRRATGKNKTSGLLGVCFHKRMNKWHAQIKVSGKQHTVGYFESPEEAGEAYLEAKRQLHPGCTI